MARADAGPFWEKDSSWLIHLAESGQETAEVLVSRYGMALRRRNQRLGSVAEKLGELHRALTKLPETCPPRAEARLFAALAALRRSLADLRPTRVYYLAASNSFLRRIVG